MAFLPSLSIPRHTFYPQTCHYMLCMVMAIIIPLLPAIPWIPGDVQVSESFTLNPITLTVPSLSTIPDVCGTNGTHRSIDYAAIAIGLYALVTTILLLRSILRLASVILLGKRCSKVSYGSYIVQRIPGSSAGPFSFFSNIYAGEHAHLTCYSECTVYRSSHLDSSVTVQIILDCD